MKEFNRISLNRIKDINRRFLSIVKDFQIFFYNSHYILPHFNRID